MDITLKAGCIYRSRRDPNLIYRITDICGQKVTAELHSVDGVAAPTAEPVELSLGRARASFVPVDELATDADTDDQIDIGPPGGAEVSECAARAGGIGAP
jgi:hypothetical protein